ncbi:alpha-galactosidase [Pedococcus sp. 5OH_020]|uniref:alpha-galactosidase n=1 Tax=Pedococcus sp. 5OH_020 TaxID=2989814 RepID=UPI0022E99CE6|nr:alpha-galactosidase [Pedococcus sp. 5OH_020]
MGGSADGTLIHLMTHEVSILLDLTENRLPSVIHWGASLGRIEDSLARRLGEASVPVVGPNSVDVPVRLAVLPEHHTGFVGRPGLTGSRGGGSWSTNFEVVSVAVDGAPVAGWHQGGPSLVTVDARDEEAALALTLEVQLLDSGLVRTRAMVTNLAADPYALDGLVLALPVPERATEILDFAGRWGYERAPQRAPLGVGTHLREGRKGRTGADAATLLHVGTEGFGFGSGEIWAVHTAWSGNHIHYAELTFEGQRVIGGGELLLPGELVLGADHTYTTPWIYAAYGRGLDAVAHQFHRYLRGRPHHVSADRPVTLNVWEAVYYQHDVEQLVDLAERAAALGVERFVLDDGWFGDRRDDLRGLGDWVVSKDVWPEGLHPIVNRVRELGMEFGLWFEPEMINADSDAARAHPEWIMSARTEWPVESRHQQVINLGIPECYDHVLGQILAILDEYEIGYIKWDHNRDLIEAGTQTDHGRPGVHAQTLAVYRMLAELKAAHPGLEVESCSSGGGRVDLGILEHTDRVWVSDCIDPLERQSMLRWTGQLIPPELMGSHIASGRSHTTGRTHDLNFRAATAIFGHLGIEWDLAQASERALDELGDWVRLYKDLRQLLLTGDLVRMDAVTPGSLVHGVVAPDRSEALFALVSVASPLTDPVGRLRLRGLDPHTTYQVTPTLVACSPSGLVPPPWWGKGNPATFDPGHPYRGLEAAQDFAGAEFSGTSLEHVGVRPPRLHPDQAVLFRLTATDTSSRGGEGQAAL